MVVNNAGIMNLAPFAKMTDEQFDRMVTLVEGTPVKRLVEPEDIANVVASMRSRDGHWVTGQVVLANGSIV